MLGALLALTTGCSLVVADGVADLTTSLNGKRDVRVTMLDLDPHVGQYLDFQVIEPGDPTDATSFPQLEARAVIDPLPTPCFEILWPRGSSLGATRLDFYADLNLDGVLSAPGDDHVWRRELTNEADGTGTHRFIHDINFDDIRSSQATATGVDVEVALTGIDAQNGQIAIVTLIRDFRDAPELPQQESVFGIGVVGAVEAGMMNITIPGLLDASGDHRIELDFGEGAMTCRREFTAPASGAFVVDSLDAFDCGVTDRHIVFRDIADAMCRG